jgi:hypothetical protein
LCGLGRCAWRGNGNRAAQALQKLLVGAVRLLQPAGELLDETYFAGGRRLGLCPGRIGGHNVEGDQNGGESAGRRHAPRQAAKALVMPIPNPISAGIFSSLHDDPDTIWQRCHRA